MKEFKNTINNMYHKYIKKKDDYILYGNFYYNKAFEERFSFRFKGHAGNWVSSLTNGDFFTGFMIFI